MSPFSTRNNGEANDGPCPAFSLCLPAWNEEANLETCLDEAKAMLSVVVSSFEIIVVDDGSSDSTADLVRRYSSQDARIRLVSHGQNRGYGAAVATAFAQSRGQVVMLMDSDRQFRVADVGPFLDRISDYDVVVGVRQPRAEGSLRRFNAWAWGLLVRCTLGVRLRDLDCAYKLFRREALMGMELSSTGSAVSAELVLRCKQRGLRIAELPVRHYPRPAGRATGAHVRVILNAIRELASLIRLRLNAIPVRPSVHSGCADK